MQVRMLASRFGASGTLYAAGTTYYLADDLAYLYIGQGAAVAVTAGIPAATKRDQPLMVNAAEESSIRSLVSGDGIRAAAAVNTIFALGDSRVSANGVDPTNSWNIVSSIVLRCADKLTYVGRLAGGGYTLEQQRDSFLPTVLALTGVRKPKFCVLGFVGNSLAVSGGVGWQSSTTLAVLAKMCDDLERKGIMPILCNETPRSDSAQVNANVLVWNSVIAAFASSRGYYLIDLFGAAADPVTMTWRPGYQTDGIHYVQAGASATASAVSAALARALPRMVNLRQQYVGGDNLIPSNQGLFLLDSNANGLADGLSDFSTGAVYSIVDDGLCAGKWQRISRAPSGASGNSLARFDVTTAGAEGDVMMLGARVRSFGMEANQNWSITADLRKSGATVNPGAGSTGWSSIQQDVNTTFQALFTVPAGGIDAIRPSISLGMPTGVSGYVDVAEMTVLNLTAMGLA